MNKTKKFLSIVLILIISIAVLPNNTIDAKAANKTFSAEYTGNFNGDPFEFEIYNVNKAENAFNGHVNIDSDVATIDNDISGTITFYDTYYTCEFSFKFSWIFFTYDASFTITVNPLEGTATGTGGGGSLLYDTDFPLTGTANKYYNKDLSFSEDDMKMC